MVSTAAGNTSTPPASDRCCTISKTDQVFERVSGSPRDFLDPEWRRRDREDYRPETFDWALHPNGTTSPHAPAKKNSRTMGGQNTSSQVKGRDLASAILGGMSRALSRSRDGIASPAAAREDVKNPHGEEARKRRLADDASASAARKTMKGPRWQPGLSSFENGAGKEGGALLQG